MKKYTSLKKNVIEQKFENGETKYFVEFVTSTFTKSILFGAQNSQNTVRDCKTFYSKDGAELYAKYADIPTTEDDRYIDRRYRVYS